MNGESEDATDVVGVTVADRGDIWLNTDFLRTNIQGDHSTGVRTLRWNNKVCLVAGTDDGDHEVTVAQTLSPEKAREIGETLLQAADDAEEMHQKAIEYDPDEEKSFLRRLIS